METSNLWSAISLSNITARATENTLQWPLECCLYGWQLILQYYPVMMTYEQDFWTGSHKMLIYFTKWRRTKTQRSQGHFARISDTRETKSLNSKVRSDEKLQKAQSYVVSRFRYGKWRAIQLSWRTIHMDAMGWKVRNIGLNAWI